MAGLRFLPRGALVNPRTGMSTPIWERYLRDLQTAVLLSTTLDKSDQSGAIGSTSLLNVGAAGGLYRLSYYTQVIQAATVSSALTVTFGWTHALAGQTQSGALLNGNTTTTQESNVLIVRTDANTSITFSTTYASVGATSMLYRLSIALERLA